MLIEISFKDASVFLSISIWLLSEKNARVEKWNVEYIRSIRSIFHVDLVSRKPSFLSTSHFVS